MTSGEDILKKHDSDSAQNSDDLLNINEQPDNASLSCEVETITEDSGKTEPSPSFKYDKTKTDEQCCNQAFEDKNESTDPALSNNAFNKINDIQLSVGHLESAVQSITESVPKISDEIREVHKLYHNEFAGRLRSMQEELERYREIDKGRVFDGILSELAKLYSNYESILDEVMDEKQKKRIGYMFLDIIQILEINGVCKQKSKQGDKRTKHCKIIERVLTDNPDLHDTIVQSRSTGFYIENRSLIEEHVDIYLFSETKQL